MAARDYKKEYARDHSKLQTNNLIWMWGPKELTLEQAETIACHIMECILTGGIPK